MTPCLIRAALLLAAAAAAVALPSPPSSLATIPGQSPLLAWRGRHRLEDDGVGVSFDWPGVAFRFTLTRATAVNATLVTGAAHTKFRVDVSSTTSHASPPPPAYFIANASNGDDYVLAAGLDPAANYTVAVYNTQEPTYIHRIWDGGAAAPTADTPTLVQVATDGAFGPPPAASTRTLLFVGDSITSGFGAGGDAPCTPGLATNDHSLTYANLLCGALDAECLATVAWAGNGVVAACCNETELLPAARRPTATLTSPRAPTACSSTRAPTTGTTATRATRRGWRPLRTRTPPWWSTSAATTSAGCRRSSWAWDPSWTATAPRQRRWRRAWVR
jgi:hypothetical protein